MIINTLRIPMIYCANLLQLYWQLVLILNTFVNVWNFISVYICNVVLFILTDRTQYLDPDYLKYSVVRNQIFLSPALQDFKYSIVEKFEKIQNSPSLNAVLRQSFFFFRLKSLFHGQFKIPPVPASTLPDFDNVNSRRVIRLFFFWFN
jgi:hypothetical protein